MGELIGGGGAGGAEGQVERGSDPGLLEEKQGSSTKDLGKQNTRRHFRNTSAGGCDNVPRQTDLITWQQAGRRSGYLSRC